MWVVLCRVQPGFDVVQVLAYPLYIERRLLQHLSECTLSNCYIIVVHKLADLQRTKRFLSGSFQNNMEFMELKTFFRPIDAEKFGQMCDL